MPKPTLLAATMRSTPLIAISQVVAATAEMRYHAESSTTAAARGRRIDQFGIDCHESSAVILPLSAGDIARGWGRDQSSAR